MNHSFYTAAAGVTSQQNKFNVIANNVANVNTSGYKTKNAVFQDLVYHNMRAVEDPLTDLTASSGAKVSHTNTDFSPSAYAPTYNEYHFAIQGEGFFMIENPISEEITYTRNGNFSLSLRENGNFYLATTEGKLVLDAQQNPILIDDTKELTALPGVFVFDNTDGMLSVGDSEFSPLEKNGEPTLRQDASVMQGYLEQSNVDMAGEMANIIETQRAYSYILKMMQTSDEVQQVINNLRG